MLLDFIGIEDLKKTDLKDLPELASKIRKIMIQVVSTNGGHLSSSLGAVELAIALHYVFNSPEDKIVWDVGHQAYAHKLLTGRIQEFSSIRKKNGLSGFPKRIESTHDAFGTGHASTSISAALGMSVALNLQGKDQKVIAVIGDGAMTGGLAYEGLNNIRSNLKASKNLIIVFNDNGMSISPNVGALSSLFSRKITGSFYSRLREEIKHILSDRTVRFLRKLKHVFKNIILPGEFFESMGLRYIGPIDGHNLKELIEVLSNLAKTKQDAPVLLHIRTQKGKGYALAENYPTVYHGVSSFIPAKGVEVNLGSSSNLSYTDVFSKTICDLAEKNKNIVTITAAMTTGTGLSSFANKFPERFYDVGIAEAHAVTFAAGLATQGFKPVIAMYSTFLQRAYDQIIHDVALQNLPVIFAVDRAGVVGADGPTHHGAFDISYSRIIPNLVVMAPQNLKELRDMLFSAFHYNKPVILRYPREKFKDCNMPEGFNYIELGSYSTLLSCSGKNNKFLPKILLLSVGSMSDKALQVAEHLVSQNYSIEAINVRFIKPISRVLLDKICVADLVFTLEENIISGGFGSALIEELLKNKPGNEISHIAKFGFADTFLPQGSREELLKDSQLDVESIIHNIEKRVYSFLKNNINNKNEVFLNSIKLEINQDTEFNEKRTN